MRTGAHVEIIGRDIPYEKAFPVLKRLGAEGVELVYRENGLLSMASRDSDFIRARRLAEENGLVISGMTDGYTWSKPMTSDSWVTRRIGHLALLRGLEGAALLGTDSMQVVPGYAVSSFVESDETVPPDIAVSRALEELCSDADRALQLGVSMNVEVVWNGMLRTPEAMRNFIDKAGTPAVKAYFDTGNVYPEGDPEKWIRVLGRRIARVHIKDYSPGREGLNAFGRLGTGVIDFQAVVTALREAGYDGWLGAEHHINRNEEEAAHSIRFIHQLAQGG